MVIAVIALLSGLTLTRFDSFHCSVVGFSSGILSFMLFTFHYFSFSSSITVQPEDRSAFQRWAGSIHKCCMVTAAATTGMAVSTVSEVPISEVSAVTITMSSGSRPIPASLLGGLADLLASLVRTAVHSELLGAAGQHHLPSSPPVTGGPSMALTASVSTPLVVSLPSSLFVPMVLVVPPTPVVSSSFSFAAARRILPGMFLPVYLHNLLGGAFRLCLDCLSQPS